MLRSPNRVVVPLLQCWVHTVPMAAHNTDRLPVAHRVQVRMADLDGTSLELDAKRRAYYARKRKHIKENIEKTDMGHTPAPQEDEDPELISALAQLIPRLEWAACWWPSCKCVLHNLVPLPLCWADFPVSPWHGLFHDWHVIDNTCLLLWRTVLCWASGFNTAACAIPPLRCPCVNSPLVPLQMRACALRRSRWRCTTSW